MYSKNYFFLDWVIFLLPISIIIGNAAININCLIIIILFCVNIFVKKVNLIKNTQTKILFFLFLLFFSLNIYFSVHLQISLISFIGIIKYALLSLAIIYCCKNIEDFMYKFSKLILIILILVGLDTLLQFFIGADIFGYTLRSNHGVRLSGPFGDEYIVGSYMSKFGLIGLFYLNRGKKIYEFLYLTFIIGIVILSNERSASILCLASIIIYFILNPSFKIKTKITYFIGLMALIFTLFNINTQLKDHYVKRTAQQFGNADNADYQHRSFKDSRWGAHFLTAIEISKNNIILGSGLHTFRIECRNKKYEIIDSVRFKERCNTHPHNIYFEIWSELGTLFFIFFIIFILYFLFKLFKIYFFNKKYQQEAAIVISLYSMLFFPIQTTGSLFSTWNGVIYWVVLALCINLFNKTLKN